jgi:hypothetical protein
MAVGPAAPSRPVRADRTEASPAAGDPVIARVAGRSIRRSDVERRMQALRHGPRGRHVPPGEWTGSAGVGRWVVQELITEAVLAHEARAAGIGGLDDGMAASPSADEVGALVDRVTASVAVDEDDVRAYYERNPDRYRRPEARRVRHVLSLDEPAAFRVVDRLVAGEDMATLAGAESIDAGSRGQGGDLGAVHRGELSGPLEDAIFAAAIGLVEEPIPSEHGWHVVRVEAVEPETFVPFEAARPAIEAELLAEARAAAFGAWLEARRTELAVVEPGYEHPADPVHGLATHRH